METPLEKCDRAHRLVLNRAAIFVLSLASIGFTSNSLASGPETTLPALNEHTPDARVELYPFFRGGRMGLIDATGKEVVPPQFDALGKNLSLPPPFSVSNPLINMLMFLRASPSHYPITVKTFPFSRNGRWGFMDDRGQIVIEEVFEEAKFFGESVPLAPAKTKDGWGFIDHQGRWVIAPRFEDTVGFFKRAAPVKENGRWGLIRPDGTLACPAILDEYPWPGMGSELLPVKSANKAGYVDDDGRLTIPLRFEAAGNFREGLGPVRSNGKWGFVDRTGNFVIQPIFDSAGSFFNDLATIDNRKRKCGYIDREGKIVVPPTYDWCDPFLDVLARVKSGDKWGFVDRSGKLVVGLEYPTAWGFGADGLALVANKKGKCGYIDRQGKLAIPLRFDWAGAFSEGLAVISVGLRNKGYIDTSGSVGIEPQFLDAYSFKGSLALVELKDAIGYVDRTGRRVHVTTYGDMLAH